MKSSICGRVLFRRTTGVPFRWLWLSEKVTVGSEGITALMRRKLKRQKKRRVVSVIHIDVKFGE